ncbi:MAG: glycosyltransferase family 4 protein [Nitrospirota bacterium]
MPMKVESNQGMVQATTRSLDDAGQAFQTTAGGRRACMLSYSFYESDNRVRRYAETLARDGYQVDAVVLREDGQSRFDVLNGVRVCRIQRRVRDERGKFSYLIKLLGFFLNSSGFITKQHAQNRYDLIHVHSIPDFEVFATLFAKMTGARIILDIHDIVPEFYASKFNVRHDSVVFKALAWIEKASIAFSDHVIISNHIWENTILSRSAKKDKCTTKLNYPDVSIFYRRPRRRKDGKFIVMYPGTINWHQGLDIAVKAFAQISGQVPEAEFHIYGSGPTRNEIQSLISDLRLQDRVFLRGTLPSTQMAEVMANADLGIVPKRNDPFGGDAFSTKILEFMALGVPVVVSATRIDRYYFNDNIVRFFEPENAQDLAAAISEVARSQELRDRLTSNAMNFVSDYTWDKKEKEYLSLIDKLVGQKAG